MTLISGAGLQCRLMDEEITEQEWREFEEKVLNDPVKRRKWADRVIDAWIARRSGKLRKYSKVSKRGS